MIGDIHPSKIMDVFQLKVANIWRNKSMFIGTCAQINVCELINLLVGNLLPILCYTGPRYNGPTL